MKMNEVAELVRGVPQGLEMGLRNFWYPLMQSSELPAGRPLPMQCLGEELAVFRDGAGKPRALRDRCPHRNVRLSVGRIMDGDLQCAYHGLRFNGSGGCTLIPWEAQPKPEALDRLGARSYPCDELGGLIWVYVGDNDELPVPDLRTMVPEELLDDEGFAVFLLPTETWDANWLLVIDGSDAYHAVTLHMESQQHAEVESYLGLEGASQPKKVPLEDRRVKIVETEGHGLRGVSVGLDGELLDHGHGLFKIGGERFNLPAMITNVLKPVSGAQPYVSRLFQVPIDYAHTRIFRYAAWRLTSPDQRDSLRRHFETVVRPRQLRTSAEDRAMAAVAGDLIESRTHEILLGPDRDMVRIRRRLAAAHVSQVVDRRRTPADEPTPTRESLAFPV